MILLSEIIRYLIVVLFGMAIGSFLNVVIYRLPRGESIVFPPSRCPQCGTPIRYRDNIPLFGYLLLRGKCRSCGCGISLQYPLIECLTGCLYGALYFLHGPTVPFLSQAVLGSILVAALVIDLRYMIVPDRLMLIGGILGIASSLVYGWVGLMRAFSGSLAGLLILFAMWGVGWFLYRRESVGWGDFKLVAVTGLFLGPLLNSAALILAIAIGGTWGIMLLVAGKKLAGRETPFVPFIAAGCFTVMLLGGQILSLLNAWLRILRG